MTNVKHRLLKLCQEFADHRIATATQAMNDAQQAANAEEKSSAGDKYETGRAMMHLEREKSLQQVEEGMKLKQVLAQIDPEQSSTRIGLGSLVITKTNSIFLAIGIGKVNLDGKDYLIVAPHSPLGKNLVNKTVQDAFMFNGQDIEISKIL